MDEIQLIVFERTDNFSVFVLYVINCQSYVYFNVMNKRFFENLLTFKKIVLESQKEPRTI